VNLLKKSTIASKLKTPAAKAQQQIDILDEFRTKMEFLEKILKVQEGYRALGERTSDYHEKSGIKKILKYFKKDNAARYNIRLSKLLKSQKITFVDIASVYKTIIQKITPPYPPEFFKEIEKIYNKDNEVNLSTDEKHRLAADILIIFTRFLPNNALAYYLQRTISLLQLAAKSENNTTDIATWAYILIPTDTAIMDEEYTRKDSLDIPVIVFLITYLIIE